MSKAKTSFILTRCPNCNHEFTVVKFHKKEKVDKEELEKMFKKYKKYERELGIAVKLCSKADGKEASIYYLYKILKFIYYESGGLFKFIRALNNYVLREYYKQAKGLAYFLTMCKNINLKGGENDYRSLETESFTKSGERTIRPAGKEL